MIFSNCILKFGVSILISLPLGCYLTLLSIKNLILRINNRDPINKRSISLVKLIFFIIRRDRVMLRLLFILWIWVEYKHSIITYKKYLFLFFVNIISICYIEIEVNSLLVIKSHTNHYDDQNSLLKYILYWSIERLIQNYLIQDF